MANVFSEYIKKKSTICTEHKDEVRETHTHVNGLVCICLCLRVMLSFEPNEASSQSEEREMNLKQDGTV